MTGHIIRRKRTDRCTNSKVVFADDDVLCPSLLLLVFLLIMFRVLTSHVR